MAGRSLPATRIGRTWISSTHGRRASAASTWKDWSRPLALSDDGTTLAFGEGGLSSGDGKLSGYIRNTDGSPAILLGDTGNPVAISPDRKWVLTTSPAIDRLSLTPTGAGESRPIDTGNVTRFNLFSGGTRWMADGQRIVFVGSETGRPQRVFVHDLQGGSPRAITPEGVFGPLVVSPDGQAIIVRDSEKRLLRYPIADGTPSNVAGALAGDEPLAWSPDGASIWVLSRATTPARIFRVDLRHGRRLPWRDVPYPDPAATERGQLRVVMSADGTRFVYGYHQHLSELYVAQGLK